MDIAVLCQWLMVAQIAGAFFCGVYTDFNGRKAIQPHGFGGFVVSLVVTCAMAAIWYGAGAFSRITS